MTASTCTLELFWDGSWQTAGSLRSHDIGRGMQGPTSFDYDSDYLLNTVDFQVHRDARAVSCRYPTTFDTFADKTWPAFLLDIVPSGFAR